jgi:hypothetical protein
MAFNKLRYPNSPTHAAQRRFFMGCHDASGQFLAGDIQVEVMAGRTYRSVLDEALTPIVPLPPD